MQVNNMKSPTLNRIGIVAVSGASLLTVLFSQAAFAQAGSSDPVTVASLLGNTTVRSSEARFQPLASAVVNDALGLDAGSSARYGRWIFAKTIGPNWVDRYLIKTSARGAKPGEMRPLTNAEALLVETLFRQEHKSEIKGLTLDSAGFAGAITPRDLGLKSPQLVEKAKAFGTSKGEAYIKAAKELKL